VSLVTAVQVPQRPVSLLEPIIGGPRYIRLVEAADQVRQLLAGRTIWNVNSTATGGGVAEMLQVLVGYVSELDILIGWLVITGDAEFFAITKRLHNQIHGEVAGGPLGATEAHQYTQMLTANAAELLDRIRPGDVALLPADRRPGWAAGAGGRPGGVALPHRRQLGERHHPGRVGLPAAPPGPGGEICVLAPGIRASVVAG